MRFVLVLEGLFGELLFQGEARHTVLEFFAFPLDDTDRFTDRELMCQFDRTQLGLEFLDLRFLSGGGLLHLALQTRPGQLGGSLLVLPGLFEFVRQGIALLDHRTQSFAHGQLARYVGGVNARLEVLDLSLLTGGGALPLATELSLG